MFCRARSFQILSLSALTLCEKQRFMYLLAPWSTVLPEKLTGSQVVKKFHAFYGTRRLFTAFASVPPVPILRQLDPVHTPTSQFLNIHINIILPFTPGSTKWSLSLIFPHKNTVYASPLPTYVLHAPPISFFSICSTEKY
jgi:hypothetical protein